MYAIRSYYATQLVLQPLGFAESRTVVQAVCGTTRVPEALTQAILTKAEGNPFFLEELARTMLEQEEGQREALHLGLHPVAPALQEVAERNNFV